MLKRDGFFGGEGVGFGDGECLENILKGDVFGNGGRGKGARTVVLDNGTRYNINSHKGRIDAYLAVCGERGVDVDYSVLADHVRGSSYLSRSSKGDSLLKDVCYRDDSGDADYWRDYFVGDVEEKRDQLEDRVGVSKKVSKGGGLKGLLRAGLVCAIGGIVLASYSCGYAGKGKAVSATAIENAEKDNSGNYVDSRFSEQSKRIAENNKLNIQEVPPPSKEILNFNESGKSSNFSIKKLPPLEGDSSVTSRFYIKKGDYRNVIATISKDRDKNNYRKPTKFSKISKIKKKLTSKWRSPNTPAVEKTNNFLHRVRKGDSLYLLSGLYDVPLGKIIDSNPGVKNPDLIYPDDLIAIPISPSK